MGHDMAGLDNRAGSLWSAIGRKAMQVDKLKTLHRQGNEGIGSTLVVAKRLGMGSNYRKIPWSSQHLLS